MKGFILNKAISAIVAALLAVAVVLVHPGFSSASPPYGDRVASPQLTNCSADCGTPVPKFSGSELHFTIDTQYGDYLEFELWDTSESYAWFSGGGHILTNDDLSTYAWGLKVGHSYVLRARFYEVDSNGDHQGTWSYPITAYRVN